MRLALAVVVTLLVSGCTPKDEKPGGVQPVVPNVPEGNLAPFDFNDRTVELTRHALLQISHTHRYLNLALGYKLGDRMTAYTDDSAVISMDPSCGKIQKLFPAPDREFDTPTELFRVTYSNCDYPPFLEKQQSKEALMSGAEDFAIHYDKPFPREKNPALTLGYADSLTVSSPSLRVELTARDGSRSRVARAVSLKAVRVASSEGVDTYKVTSTVRDSFSVGGPGARVGSVQVELSEVEVKVSKVDRAVTSMKAGALRVIVEGSRLSSADQGFAFELALTPQGDVVKSARVCETVAGSYRVGKVTSGSALPIGVVTSTANELKIDEAPARAALLCKDPIEDVFLDEFEALYL